MIFLFNNKMRVKHFSSKLKMMEIIECKVRVKPLLEEAMSDKLLRDKFSCSAIILCAVVCLATTTAGSCKPVDTP